MVGHLLIALDGSDASHGWGFWWKAEDSDTVTHTGV